MKRIFFAAAAVLFISGGITWAEKGELETGLADAKKALRLEPANKSYQSIVAFLEEQLATR